MNLLRCAWPVIAAGMFVSSPVVSQTLYDPMRPVSELSDSHAVVQWYTRVPCESTVQVREGGVPCMTPQPQGAQRDAWSSADVQVINGPAGTRTFHRVTLRNLKPATRYYYRCHDAGAAPTAEERAWGAQAPWQRELCINTLAPRGRRTVIRVPVKVLIIPNVINISSAYDAVTGTWAPPPPAMTGDELESIKDEYRTAARFFFINNGFRIWYDFHVLFDTRWQRWGEEPPQATGFYKGLLLCRNWPGVDFRAPGGGDFTPVDTTDITQPGTYPVFEKELYAGQIENQFLRRWDAASRSWQFVRSGGGTLGIDQWSKGVPARCQFLGDDIAWLTTHEFHHAIESQGWFSGLQREDDRVYFDHFSGRYRTQRPDGSYDEFPWSTAGRFGEHWSGIAYTDRLLTDVQWLRWYFGETLAVTDADNDGVPDDAPRLPFDERRFGSSPQCVATDGVMSDVDKIRLSIWCGGPLQSMWTRPTNALARPLPCNPDSDGDGIPDHADPAPLVPFPPFVWPHSAVVDGVPDEWRSTPLLGAVTAPGAEILYAHAHDEIAYYGLLAITGRWNDVRLTLDGEGDGVFGPGVGGFGGSADDYWLTIRPASNDEQAADVQVRSHGKGFTYAARRDGERTTVEFSIRNRGASTWFWQGGGRTVGVALDAGIPSGARYAMFDGYDPLYTVMLPLTGVQAPPAPPPAPPAAQDALCASDFSAGPATARWDFTGPGWSWRDGALRFDGPDDATMLVDGLCTTNFNIWIEFEATRDAVLGAFRATTRALNPGVDYIAFAGGYDNTVTRMRVEGRGEVTGDMRGLAPGRHTLQFARQHDILYLVLDGELLGWYHDASAPFVITRLGIIGIPGSQLAVFHARVDVTP